MSTPQNQRNSSARDVHHHYNGHHTSSSKALRWWEHASVVLVQNQTYKYLMFICNLILMFGRPVQMIWMPPAADLPMNVVYTIVLVVFCIDLLARSTVIPGYFTWQCKSCCTAVPATSSNSSTTGPSYTYQCCCSFGSFLLWCDLASTLSVLYNISWIYPQDRISIFIDFQDGVLMEILGENVVNDALPFEFNGVLLITIFKTARIVRFVRIPTVVNLLRRINWYAPLQICEKCWNAILQQLGCGRRRPQDENQTGTDNPQNPENLAKAKLAAFNKKKAGRKGQLRPGDNFYYDKSNPNGSADRRDSWSNLGLATLAAIKAQRLAREAEEERLQGPLGLAIRLLRRFGLYGQDDTEWKRHLAACKIQRAWRKAVAKHHHGAMDHSEHFHPVHHGGDDPVDAGGSLHGSTGSRAQERQKSVLRKSGGKSGGVALSKSFLKGAGDHHQSGSRVGGAMRELTGQRVAIGILLALLLTATFTYVENDATRQTTLLILHQQATGADPVKGLAPDSWVERSIGAARNSSIPDLYEYQFINGTTREYPIEEDDPADLRQREILEITIQTTLRGEQYTTMGRFAYRNERVAQAISELLATLFILLLWLFGVTAFAGPVMVLVVLPIERMVRLLGMLMLDPLGYQSTSRYKKFLAEEDEITKNTQWTKEVLKGMETSFLMSTILRIGSLMKVGFGSAGVEIIRKNLEKKQGGTSNMLTSQGSTVACIFLFCDIRQFTDATECLQEEVFVFTNRVAAVVHSFCHSFGGSANKNVGDAFLCSWLLDEASGGKLVAKNNQADKCLLCVVKICMALHHDKYYIETMSEAPRQRLLAKLKKRPGPVVQMGCGLHAGTAVQGAIGSERKIDATYVSEAVEMAETLESSTKKYGLKMLMSNAFHALLHLNNRNRCRLVDRIVMPDDDEDEDDLGMMFERDDILELYTFDMDIDALWQIPAPKEPLASNKVVKTEDKGVGNAGNISDADSPQDRAASKRGEMKKDRSQRVAVSTRRGGRRLSIGILSKKDISLSGTHPSKHHMIDFSMEDLGTSEQSTNFRLGGINPVAPIPPGDNKAPEQFSKPELVLPSGPALYNPSVWRNETMFIIREKYLDGLFFNKYSQGLQSFYSRDWDHAKQCFTSILEKFEDGPSRYFLNQIEKMGKPPPTFRPYGLA